MNYHFIICRAPPPYYRPAISHHVYGPAPAPAPDYVSPWVGGAELRRTASHAHPGRSKYYPATFSHAPVELRPVKVIVFPLELQTKVREDFTITFKALLRHYTMLNGCLKMVSRCEIGTQMQRSFTTGGFKTFKTFVSSSIHKCDISNGLN